MPKTVWLEHKLADTIKALRLNGTEYINPGKPDGSITRNLAVESVTLPEPAEGEVIVEPMFVGICGSDNSASTGKPNFTWVERPRTIGHEASGRIVGFGPNTEGQGGLKMGDVVCIIPMRGCGDPRCRGCRRGRPNYCRSKKIFGFHRDGAMAERMVVNVGRCMPLADGLTPLQGSVVEPLSVVAQGIHRKSNIQPGMDVVVSGCGIIGLMSAELARAAGARVAVTGIEQDRDVRLKLAQERGFIPIVVSQENPLHEQLAAGIEDLDGRRFGDAYENGTVDCLVECSGFPPALGTAGLSVQLEGSICVIATFGADVTFGATAFTRSGQSMQGVMGSNREDFETAQALLQRGVFPVDVYSQQYSFDDVVEAMEESITAKTPKAILAINA
jgi:threonine dehydrogenase-like Zn-dependent dehydrogenase